MPWYVKAAIGAGVISLVVLFVILAFNVAKSRDHH